MLGLIVALLSVVLPLVHLWISRLPRTPGRVLRLLLLYALVLNVGVIGFFLGFVPHVFFPDSPAHKLGLRQAAIARAKRLLEPVREV